MKIAFTGPESSGKTSLSKAIAQYFDAQWFAEYARAYLIERDGKYVFDDIEKIGAAQEKMRQENNQSGIKIYDTEAIVLYIWSIFKYQKYAPKIKHLMENQNFDHYFLCSPKDIPWEEDPLREHPNQREELFDLYLKELKKQKVNFTILEGDFEKRMQQAIAVISAIKK